MDFYFKTLKFWGFLFPCSFSFLWWSRATCGILVPWPGIEPMPPALEAQPRKSSFENLKKKKFILRIFFLLWILCFLLDFFTVGICLLPYIYFIASHITEVSYQFTNLNFFPWFSRNSIKGSEYKKKRINLTLQFQVWFFCLFSCLSCMR